MGRSQLNINIDPLLLKKLKEEAMKSGKTISNFVSDAISREVEHTFTRITLEARVSAIEERLKSLEVIDRKLFVDKKITPFTKREAENCNKFIQAIFQEETKRKKYQSSKDAWNDLIGYIDCFDQWNEFYTLRLKEVLFISNGDFLTSDEMNSLTNGKICPCPIRTGLIRWINDLEKGKCSCSDSSFPSQQAICNKGPKLLEELYA